METNEIIHFCVGLTGGKRRGIIRLTKDLKSVCEYCGGEKVEKKTSDND